MKKIGFILNPIAGMGGRVGLKGTDGMVDEAIELGAMQVSKDRAHAFLDHLHKDNLHEVTFLSCASPMGEDVLSNYNIPQKRVYTPSTPTTAKDTIMACKQFLKEKCDLIIFCGGDGTARDVYAAVKNSVPMFGVPSGVKMLSGVFALNPPLAAELLTLFLKGQSHLKEAEIVDLDEEAYRHDQFAFNVFGIATTIFEGNLIQSSKMLIHGPSEEDIKYDIAKTVTEDMEYGVLYILGGGSTVSAISEMLNIEYTLLGIDVVKDKKLIKKDANEAELLSLLEPEKRAAIILSPIGAQGFVIGRGNLQISQKVIEKVGLENILIVSTPAKLKTIKYLLIDSGNELLDKKFTEKRYFPVIIGYRTSTIKNIGLQNL
ncbi:MAG: ATP-NAD kinase family protein [Candidatus Methanofastidiosia archaeon]